MRKNYTPCASVFFTLLCYVLTNFLFHLFTNSFFFLCPLFFPVDSFSVLCLNTRTRCPMIGKSTPTSPAVAFATIVAAFCTAYKTKASNVHVYFSFHYTSLCTTLGVSNVHFSCLFQPVIWMYTRNARNRCQTCVDATIPSAEAGATWKFIARGINSFAKVIMVTNCRWVLLVTPWFMLSFPTIAFAAYGNIHNE